MTEAAFTQLAAVAGTFLAAGGLIATVLSIRQNTRSNDLRSLFDIVTSIRDAEMRLRAAQNEPPRLDAEIANYLNLLEVLAAAVNDDLFGPVARRVAVDRLVKDLAFFRSIPAMRERLDREMQTAETFSEIRKFFQRNERAIKAISPSGER
ncbi:hypothetical protein [Afifella marina]|uniref:Uncharacterized protein n=1 Tax=Afifella marina DSM 2698 TaxID=1120955 RepID=A0A1G5MC16_AFIMA|nr:hypothetical protein [Afifella marina]MBK1622647.1 hypothetical protein [Afifella marina DSM 2698]MBK1625642.1 hypothetical protein [Afifella marina]MBK5917465.1 hypothetical protein [Afifella marina]RAI23409.1 hypothetical protein CH311_00530 [Afifella marina DSM 2698]SCZ22695.1 hypothetical protein SAMN03080610_00446 [Afifella marina DSM 2698]